MTDVLQVGKQIIPSEAILPLLTRYQLLPQLKRELVLDEAIAHMPCTPDELPLAREQFYQQQHITSEADCQQWLHYHGIAADQLDAIAARQLRIEKFKHATFGAKVEAAYLKAKGQFDKVLYSLLRVEDWGMAQEFYFRLQASEQSFPELARHYSQGTEAQTGGLVGPVELKTLHPTLAKLLSTSQPGQLLPPIKLNEWVVIVRLEKFLAAALDEPLRQRLLHQLFNEWLQTQLQQVNTTEHAPIATLT